MFRWNLKSRVHFIQKKADQILFGLICIVPFINLFVFSEAIYPYVTSKNFLFRFIVLVGGGLWMGICLLDLSYRPRLTRLLTGLLFFLSVVLLSDLLGANFSNSFWSNFARMEGFLSLLYYLLYVFILISVLRTPYRWIVYWAIHVFVSVLIFAVVVLQKLKFIYSVDFNRVDATFGNSSYLAIYASMIFFLCIYLFFLAQKWHLKSLLLAAAFCNLLSIYFSQTRSATLAVLICLAFLVFLILPNKKKAALWIGSFFFIFVAAVSFLRNRTEFTTNLFERISRISFQDESIQARYQIWSYCWRAIQEKPWLGWGQESFTYLTQFYTPELYTSPWVDRAHNLFIEWTVNSGIFGALSLCLFLFLFFRSIWNLKSDKISQRQRSAFLALLLCWLVNQLFSIDFFSMAILFYSLLAYATSFQRPSIEKKALILTSSKGHLIFSFFLFLLISVGINYELNVKSFITNYKIRQYSKPEFIMAAGRHKPYEIGFDELLKQRNYYENPDLRLFLGQSALYVMNQPEHKNNDYLQYLYESANREIQNLLREDPENLILKYSAASFYSQFRNKPKAEALYHELLNKMPRHQFFLLDYGHFQTNQGNFSEGVRYYRTAFELDKRFDLAKMFLAMGLIYDHHFTEADQLIRELVAQSKPEGYDERLINAYANNSQPTKAAELIQYRDRFFQEKDSK